MAGRNGSRKQSPPRPEDISLHWARVSKLQDTTAEVTSLRQYSPADAGVAIATKASALSAVMGAALNFKSCFIFLSLGFLCDGFGDSMMIDIYIKQTQNGRNKRNRSFPTHESDMLKVELNLDVDRHINMFTTQHSRAHLARCWIAVASFERRCG